ncbi:ABC transporter A family member 8-like [Phragmites australis]|uniref:ABC transporter A family member 8-like n=1 Tax=Phragmites australis TaxID=29695 RepID=UPI002D798735|nr:ABC transporter A family member 8-like [Phragmites australis]
MAASCLAQTNALFRKNLVIQRRDCKTNCCLICFPFLVCLLLGGAQMVITIFYLRSVADRPRINCHYCTASTNVSSSKNTIGGLDCPAQCPLPIAPKWPPVLQLPNLPGASIGGVESRAATFLVTGGNQSFAESVMSNMFPKHDSPNFAADISTLADFALVVGTNAMRPSSLGADEYGSDFHEHSHLSFLQSNCTANRTLSFLVQEGSSNFTQDAECTEGLFLWRESLSVMNNELYRGFYQEDNETDKIASAYDLTSSDLNKFNLIVSYNPTYKGVTEISFLLLSLSFPPILLRVPRLLNLVSNAYIQLKGSDTKMRFEFVKDMPRAAQPEMPPDISFLVGKLVFVWIIMLLFPVILSNLVYEKQQKLRTMMKMHGLGDMAYWTITYCYFLLLSLLYMLFLVLFGAIVGIKLFRLNHFGVQFVIYFTYINLQISFAFLMAAYFSNARTATVTGYLFTIGSGLLGECLFRHVVVDISLSRSWTTLMEFFPPFSLYRIIYEFSPPPSVGYRTDFSGIQWSDLNDRKNGMIDILIIMVLEWATFLLLTFCLDEFGTLRNGIRKMSSVCRSCLDGSSQAAQKQTIQLREFKASVETGRTDVLREREIVEQLIQESDSSYLVICDNIKKVYRGKDGNAEKIAVGGLSLFVQRGQCFGILGPNGAGKTSLISMLTGFTKPTSGTAYIDGMNIRLDMDKIYTRIGVCPQFDLLWETLTGREHLMFYGRLKNLRGATLAVAVEQSLKSVRLFDGGVADKCVAKYSGGMKRRLSVAISLIGDSKVVYMDEPSSGLDPASRKALWNAVKSAKQDRAIILTTHSMEEAEALCDRIAIIANGSLQCIGNSKELKAKYGGAYMLTVTAAAGEEEAVEQLVRSISPAVNRTYRIAGTQKFEMPKQGVRISEVFQAMEHAKNCLNILAWGLSDTTLEDVFIKVAQESDTFSV